MSSIAVVEKDKETGKGSENGDQISDKKETAEGTHIFSMTASNDGATSYWHMIWNKKWHYL